MQLKRQLGVLKQAPGTHPQGQPQQPKKAIVKADSRLNSTLGPAAAGAPTGPVPKAAAAAAAAPRMETAHAAASGPTKVEADSGHQDVALDTAVMQQQAAEPKLKMESRGITPPGVVPQGQGADRDASEEVPRAVLGDAAMPQAVQTSSQHTAVDPGQPGKGSVGVGGQTPAQTVRQKAVAILELAFTSPCDLTPLEAAVAVEQAVFAQFAEQGVPGMR